jgi:hypothetical protein
MRLRNERHAAHVRVASIRAVQACAVHAARMRPDGRVRSACTTRACTARVDTAHAWAACPYLQINETVTTAAVHPFGHLPRGEVTITQVFGCVITRPREHTVCSCRDFGVTAISNHS